MKKFLGMMLAVALAAGAWAPANATLVTLDIFDGGANGPNDLNTNILPDRQAGSPVLSSYTWNGIGNVNAQIIDPDGPGTTFTDVMNQVIIDPVGGDHSIVHMNTDYGTAVGGKEWQISYLEFFGSDAAGNWGGWAGLFVGQTIGFGADFGMILRPDGAYSIFNGFTEIANGAVGSLAGENALYTTAVSFDEANNTVTLAQNGADVGTWATTLSGTSRYIQFRTHYDGGSAAALSTYREDLLIETIPEPASLILLTLAGIGCLAVRRSK